MERNGWITMGRFLKRCYKGNNVVRILGRRNSHWQIIGGYVHPTGACGGGMD
jgi:hypothetical protein